MPGQYGVPQHGELRFGYFYVVTFENCDLDGAALDWIRGGHLESTMSHPLGEAAFRVMSSWWKDEEYEHWNLAGDRIQWSEDESKKLLRCTKAAHNKWLRTIRLHIQVWDQRTAEQAATHGNNPVLLQWESLGNCGPRFISRELADRLVRVGITGSRFDPVEISKFCNAPGAGWPVETKTPSIDPNLVELQFVGKPCHRDAILQDAPNACPFCGFGPILCPECGRLTGHCPQCAEYVFKKNEAGKLGHKMLSGSESRQIIDGKLWDGSDLICGRDYTVGFVTRRFVD
ncbi:MAG: hypothetical protein WCO86_12975, partial [Planctomycetota bacterium]